MAFGGCDALHRAKIYVLYTSLVIENQCAIDDAAVQ